MEREIFLPRILIRRDKIIEYERYEGINVRTAQFVRYIRDLNRKHARRMSRFSDELFKPANDFLHIMARLFERRNAAETINSAGAGVVGG